MEHDDAEERTFQEALIIGAAGGVGQFMIRTLAARVRKMRCFDIAPAAGCELLDVQAPARTFLESLHEVDLVILTLPDEVAAVAAPVVLQHVCASCLVVDTCSVKWPYVKACEGRGNAEILSINPLFGPDLDIRNRTIAITALRGGPKSEQFEALLTDAGAKTIHLTSEAHDKAAALGQAVVHAILLVFSQLTLTAGAGTSAGFLTPPMRALLSMAARMLCGGHELHWAIQSKNPFARDARREFLDAFTVLNELIVHEKRAEFAKIWTQTLSAMGAESEILAQDAVEIYTRHAGGRLCDSKEKRK